MASGSGGPADTSRVDVGGMEHLLRAFYDTWKGGIEAINKDVIQSFANFHLGQEILQQVLCAGARRAPRGGTRSAGARWGTRVHDGARCRV